MRVLFSFAGGFGHLAPLVPIARAAATAGHTVAFSGRAALMPALTAEGFDAFATVPSADHGPAERKPLLEVSAEREDRVLREAFAGEAARERADGILALCAKWSPDVIVCDETDFGGVVAAERLGVPHATVLVIAAGSFVRPEVVAEPLSALRAEHGLPPDPGLEMLRRHLVLSPFPPSFRDPAFPLPDTGHSLRPTIRAAGVAPEWLQNPDGRPTVYVTLGTVFNVESGDVFARVVAGLRDLPINVVVTVGQEIDPRELDPQPSNVRIERYIAQSWLLPHCSAVVCHGGSGSVMGALAHGLPLVVIPMGADQPLNAARCEALGVGRSLDAVRAAPREISEAVTHVLTAPSYRQAALRMREEINGLAGPEHAVPLLERIVTGAGARGRATPG